MDGKLAASPNDLLVAVRGKSAAPLEAAIAAAVAALDIVVDTNRAHEVYKEWMAKTRPAGVSGDGLRRPLWFDRPLRPVPDAYKRPSE
jgi:hypothetical protein